MADSETDIANPSSICVSPATPASAYYTPLCDRTCAYHEGVLPLLSPIPECNPTGSNSSTSRPAAPRLSINTHPSERRKPSTDPYSSVRVIPATPLTAPRRPLSEVLGHAPPPSTSIRRFEKTRAGSAASTSAASSGQVNSKPSPNLLHPTYTVLTTIDSPPPAFSRNASSSSTEQDLHTATTTSSWPSELSPRLSSAASGSQRQSLGSIKIRDNETGGSKPSATPAASESRRKIPQDILIPVIGPSGGGKSTFIKNVYEALAIPKDIPIGDGFGSCTSDATPHYVGIPDDVADHYGLARKSRLVFVDTPGFDNPNLRDSEVIGRIADYMTTKYPSDIHLGGIVYAFPVYRGTGKDDFGTIKAFRDLCGEDVRGRVVIVKTKCHIPSRATDDYKIWEAFWDGYPCSLPYKMVLPLDNEPHSAWNVVQHILNQVKAEGTIFGRRRQPGLRSRIVQLLNSIQHLQVGRA